MSVNSHDGAPHTDSTSSVRHSLIQLPLDRLSESVFDEEAQLSPRTWQHAALVVDDVRSIRKLLAKVLSRLGFVVIEECENGRQALQRMQKQEFAIVFCDYHMPFMTGPEATKRFRAWEETERIGHQTIIAMSANAEPEDIAAGIVVLTGIIVVMTTAVQSMLQGNEVYPVIEYLTHGGLLSVIHRPSSWVRRISG